MKKNQSLFWLLAYPKQGFLPLLARFERQLSLPLRLRFPINEQTAYGAHFYV